MTIGKRIYELRTKAKLTQQELADRLFVTDKAVSKWERDGGEPNTQALIDIANIFSVSIDYLLTGESKEKVVVMSEIEKIAFDDDVEMAKKHSNLLGKIAPISGLSFLDYIYKYKSVNLFNHYINSYHARLLLPNHWDKKDKYLYDFILMCFETENYAAIEIINKNDYNSRKPVIQLTDIYFKDQLPEREQEYKYIINDSIVDYIINNEKALNFILKDQDIYWQNGISKILEKVVKDNNPLADKIYSFLEKRKNSNSNMPITRQTIIYALSHNNYELAEKLNSLSGGLVSSHEFKMDKVKKDTKMSKKEKLKHSVIIDGLVDIDKLIALDDYALYKEVIEEPVSKEEHAIQLAEKEKYRELLLFADKENLGYTKNAIIRDDISSLKDAIIQNFRSKNSEFNKKYLKANPSYKSKVLGKHCVLFEDIINHKDYEFFKHASQTDRNNLDWALEKLVKDRPKEYELIKMLLDEGAKLHNRYDEDDGWGYMVLRDDVDDVATQLLKNQIEIFLKEGKNND